MSRVKDRLGPLFALLGAGHLALGVLMAAAPRVFFEEIGPYAPRNDHYIRDVSSFYFAMGAVALVAFRRRAWRVPVLVFFLIQYALHSVNHLIDVGEADPKALGPINLVSLALTAGLLAYMLRTAKRSEETVA